MPSQLCGKPIGASDPDTDTDGAPRTNGNAAIDGDVHPEQPQGAVYLASATKEASPFDRNPFPAGFITNLEPPCPPRRPRSPAESVIALERLTRSIRRMTSDIRSTSRASNKATRGSSPSANSTQEEKELTASQEPPSTPNTLLLTSSQREDPVPDLQALGIVRPTQTGVPASSAVSVSPPDIPDVKGACTILTSEEKASRPSSPPKIPFVGDTQMSAMHEAQASSPSTPSTPETVILASFPKPPSSSSSQPVRRPRTPVPNRRVKLPPVPGLPPALSLPDRPAPDAKIVHSVGVILAARRPCGPSPTVPPTSIHEDDRFEVLDAHPSGYILVKHLRLAVKVRIPAELLIPTAPQAQRRRSKVKFDVAATEEQERPRPGNQPRKAKEAPPNGQGPQKFPYTA